MTEKLKTVMVTFKDLAGVVHIADHLLGAIHEFGDDTDAYAEDVARLDDALRKLGMGSAKFEAPSDDELLAKVEREERHIT